MGLRRIINNCTGKSLSEKVIEKLDSSRGKSMEYKGGILKRDSENKIIYIMPPGYQKIYSSEGRMHSFGYFP
jgi:hypothetical protein